MRTDRDTLGSSGPEDTTCATAMPVEFRSDRIGPPTRAFQIVTSDDAVDSKTSADMICLIATIDSRRGVATDSGIPWKLPETRPTSTPDRYWRHRDGWATSNEFAALSVDMNHR